MIIYLDVTDGRTMDTKTSSGFVLWLAPWRRRRQRRGMNEWWRGGFANNLRLITVGTHNGLVHVLLLSSSSSVISHRWMNGWSVMYRKLLLLSGDAAWDSIYLYLYFRYKPCAYHYTYIVVIRATIKGGFLRILNSCYNWDFLINKIEIMKHNLKFREDFES